MQPMVADCAASGGSARLSSTELTAQRARSPTGTTEIAVHEADIARAARPSNFRARLPHLDPRPRPKFEHHHARHEHTLIAAASSQMTANSPRGTFSQAELAGDMVITRSGPRRLTRDAIWVARVDLPIPPTPCTISAVTFGPVRSADQRRRSADRMDRDVRCGGTAPDVREWRAECRARAGVSSGTARLTGGMSCGATPRVNAALSCRIRTNFAIIPPLPRSPADGSSRYSPVI